LLDSPEERRTRREVRRVAADGRGEIETKPVDVHLLDPIAEALEGEGAHLRCGEVEGVAAAREVLVARRVVRPQPVVGGVVDASQAERRAGGATLGGVVQNDVEYHLDTRAMKRSHHRLELRHLLAEMPGGVGRVRREERDRAVAPVVGQCPGSEVALRGEVLDRHELHGGDSEALEVLENRLLDESEIGPAKRRRHFGMERRQPLHVAFVDQGAGPPRAWR
jgi:hypothetical protein